MHALVLFCINQYTTFEVPSFTSYKDLIGAKFKNGSRDFDYAPSGVVCRRRLGFDTVYLLAKLDDSSLSRSRDRYHWGVKI